MTRAIQELTTEIHKHLIPNGAGRASDDDASLAPAKSSKPQNNDS